MKESSIENNTTIYNRLILCNTFCQIFRIIKLLTTVSLPNNRTKKCITWFRKTLTLEMKATHCTTVSTHLSDKADVSEGSEE